MQSTFDARSVREQFPALRRTHEGHAVAYGVKLYAAPDDVRKTPTVAFRVEGRTPREVCENVLKFGYFIAAGDFYASTLAERLGIRGRGGWARAGLAPYNTAEEVEGFIESPEEIVRGGR